MAAQWNLFGFKITRGSEEQEQNQAEKEKSFALPQNDDGAVTIQTGAYFGTYVDMEGIVRNEIELITRYREMSMQPELESAIDDIVTKALFLMIMARQLKSIQMILSNPQQSRKESPKNSKFS